MLLDVVEVARSHTSLALAEEFARILKENGIMDKVSIVDSKGDMHTNSRSWARLVISLRTMHRPTTRWLMSCQIVLPASKVK